MSGLALFKSASPMDYQSIKSAVHPAVVLEELISNHSQDQKNWLITKGLNLTNSFFIMLTNFFQEIAIY